MKKNSGRRPRRQQDRSAASRARLVHAAASEFAARGFAGANVDRIARAARVNKAMIYYHFKSKQALYRRLLRDMFTLVGNGCSRSPPAAGPPAKRSTRRSPCSPT